MLNFIFYTLEKVSLSMINYLNTYKIDALEFAQSIRAHGESSTMRLLN